MQARRSLHILLLACLAAALPLHAQTTQLPFTYDAASIKLNKSGSFSTHEDITSDHYRAGNLSIKNLIVTAYNLQTDNLIDNLPPWATSARFDIQAKVDAETLARLKTLDSKQNTEARAQMLQALLADRFQLQVHRETKDLPIYALVVAKSGLKIKPADPSDTYANGLLNGKGTPRGAGSVSTENGVMTAQGAPLLNLASYLSYLLHRKVEDQTATTAKYDWQLKWSRDDADSTDSAPGIFTALQEQLGLKLEPTRGPVETIVIDRIELPQAD